MSKNENTIEIFPDNDPKTNLRWYALYTKPRAEKKVLDRLQDKDIITYLPMKKEKRRWSDRTKVVEVPLLRSYIFVKIPLVKSLYVLKTQGVIGFVKFLDQYAPIPEYQIKTLKKSLQVISNLEPVDYLKEGQLVQVVSGPLEGAVGRIKKVRNRSKLIISLDALQSSYGINIDPENVKPVNKKKHLE